MALKILFICGSIEPGRDGVGDYTLALANELLASGNEVAVIALNDTYAKEEFSTEGKVVTLRLPGALVEKTRFERAKIWLDRFNPDVVSLQYVPYSFHHKGIPFSLVKQLKTLLARRTFHIMFHELWLDTPKNFKQRFVLWSQKYIAGRCVAVLKPAVVNVSMAYNKDRLAGIGITATELQLFGNISHYEGQYDMSAKGIDLNKFKVLYFGLAPKDFLVDEIITGLIAYCEQHEGGLQFIIGCGEGENKNVFLNSLKERLAGYPIQFIDCGFLSFEEVSTLMNICQVGIARSIAYLLGKSGSAIAMLEHGMSIWMPKLKTGEKLDFNFRRELIFNNLKDAADFRARPGYLSLLPQVAKQFINQF